MSTSLRPGPTGTRWRNWSGLEEALAQRVETPSSVDAVADAVRRARADGTTVKMAGSGHSFTAIAAPEHTLLRPEALSGAHKGDWHWGNGQATFGHLIGGYDAG